jgi:hypothetical protein
VGNAMAAQAVHRTTADEPDQTRCHEGPTIQLRPAAREPPPLTSLVSPCGPANLWAKCRPWAIGAGELFKFRPLDKDDAVPTVRKADGGKCEGGPVGTTYNGPMGPDQNRCEERAQFSSTAPGRNPHPSPHSFDRLGQPGACAAISRNPAEKKENRAVYRGGESDLLC